MDVSVEDADCTLRCGSKWFRTIIINLDENNILSSLSSFFHGRVAGLTITMVIILSVLRQGTCSSLKLVRRSISGWLHVYAMPAVCVSARWRILIGTSYLTHQQTPYIFPFIDNKPSSKRHYISYIHPSSGASSSHHVWCAYMEFSRWQPLDGDRFRRIACINHVMYWNVYHITIYARLGVRICDITDV